MPVSAAGTLRRRQNLARRTEERWRPPTFHRPVSTFQQFTAWLRRFFDLQAGSIWRDLAAELPRVTGRVLDAGCGAQPYRELLSKEVIYRGIDSIDAKAHFGYETPDTVYYAGDVWPVDDHAIDVVLCAETLEHVPDPGAFLGEMRRCLRPAGRIVLTVPFAVRWHFIPHDYWRFTPSGLDRLLTQAGFTKVEIYARGNAITVACYKLMALFLPLLFPQGLGPGYRWALRLVGVWTLPVVVVLATIGTLSLRMPGGDDCLGYTVLAERDARPMARTSRS